MGRDGDCRIPGSYPVNHSKWVWKSHRQFITAQINNRAECPEYAWDSQHTV